MAGAASEIAQIGEHLLASGLSDAVGTEHVGKMDRLRMVRNCATWSARRECDACVMHVGGSGGWSARVQHAHPRQRPGGGGEVRREEARAHAGGAIDDRPAPGAAAGSAARDDRPRGPEN